MLAQDIIDEAKWNEFLDYRNSKDFISKKEKKEFEEFINNKKYMTICSQIALGTYSFSIPKKHLISKGHSSKKRVVYSFNNEEMLVLKYISYLLYDYDYLFSPNLYSFRNNASVKNAIRNISNIKNLYNMHGYKVDISNYFNSIDVDILLANLKNDIRDELLYNLIASILLNDCAMFHDEIIHEPKGAMAGIPISAFLANYFIKEIDEYFWNKNVVYSRYADDIILFCNSKEELSWKYWFFPTITTAESLKIIDNYMQEQERYIVTGKHNKRNYKIVPYSLLKDCNYKSLVNEYYNDLFLDMEN